MVFDVSQSVFISIPATHEQHAVSMDGHLCSDAVLAMAPYGVTALLRQDGWEARSTKCPATLHTGSTNKIDHFDEAQDPLFKPTTSQRTGAACTSPSTVCLPAAAALRIAESWLHGANVLDPLAHFMEHIVVVLPCQSQQVPCTHCRHPAPAPAPARLPRRWSQSQAQLQYPRGCHARPIFDQPHAWCRCHIVAVYIADWP